MNPSDNTIDSEVRAKILAALRTNCHRPNCKVKHQAKLEDSITKLTNLIAQEANKARLDEQEIVAQNLPHCGGDMCMSCHFTDDFQKGRIKELTADKEAV